MGRFFTPSVMNLGPDWGFRFLSWWSEKVERPSGVETSDLRVFDLSPPSKRDRVQTSTGVSRQRILGRSGEGGDYLETTLPLWRTCARHSTNRRRCRIEPRLLTVQIRIELVVGPTIRIGRVKEQTQSEHLYTKCRTTWVGISIVTWYWYGVTGKRVFNGRG